jgi:hypothetical protein
MKSKHSHVYKTASHILAPDPLNEKKISLSCGREYLLIQKCDILNTVLQKEEFELSCIVSYWCIPVGHIGLRKSCGMLFYVLGLGRMLPYDENLDVITVIKFISYHTVQDLHHLM